MEIPTNAWPNIVETLVSFIVNAGNPAPLRQASFTALGIICDDVRHMFRMQIYRRPMAHLL